MTLKSDAKLTRGFKYDIQNLVNFNPTIQKSENFILMSSFCPKYKRFELKNTEELSFMTLNSDENLNKPKPCENCNLMGSFCPKYIMFQLENFRGIMCHETKG